MFLCTSVHDHLTKCVLNACNFANKVFGVSKSIKYFRRKFMATGLWGTLHLHCELLCKSWHFTCKHVLFMLLVFFWKQSYKQDCDLSHFFCFYICQSCLFWVLIGCIFIHKFSWKKTPLVRDRMSLTKPDRKIVSPLTGFKNTAEGCALLCLTSAASNQSS